MYIVTKLKVNTTADQVMWNIKRRAACTSKYLAIFTQFYDK